MEIDSEEPPNLIEIAGADAHVSDPTASQLQDLSISKVPLTIVTEFGDSTDIEKALTVTQEGQSSQEWLELGNGCICCSIKDSGVNAIESLMARAGTFDYIMLETSGLADPGNLAPLFWVDDGLGSSIYLDGIVTLVDAKNVLRSLDEKPVQKLEQEEDGHDGPHETTAHLQISHADVIVINKCNSVTPEALTDIEARIRSINGLAKIHKTQYSQVPQLESFLLDLHAYDGVESLDTANQAHSHLDPAISTHTFPIPTLTPSQLPAFESWLRSLLWESSLLIPSGSQQEPLTNQPQPPQSPTSPSPPLALTATQLPPQTAFHRIKGRILITDGSVKMLQGVREVFEIVEMEGGGGEGMGKGKMVIIGKGLGEVDLEGSLVACLDYAGDSA